MNKFHSLLRWFRNSFGFTPSEERGFVILSLFLGGYVLLAVILPSIAEPHRSFHIAISDSLFQQQRVFIEPQAAAPLPDTLLPFDPNQASLDEWLAAGLDSVLSQRILNYRQKGGAFYSRQDLLKIYGLDSSTWQSILPLIKISENVKNKDYTTSPQRKGKQLAAIDINTADSALFRSVTGIGPVLSARIVSFREALGGYVSKNQLKEVYFITEEGLSGLMERGYVSPDFIPAQLNINQLDAAQMANHPYISWSMANLITAYREQHGAYKSVGDVFLIKALDSAEVGRIIPYLAIE